MARSCSICQHRARAQIEAALNRGGSLRQVAERFGISHSALDRHRKAGHMDGAALPIALPVLSGDVERVTPIPAYKDALAQLQALRASTLDSLNMVRQRGEEPLAIAYTKEMRMLLQAEIEAQAAKVTFDESAEGTRARIAKEQADRAKALDLMGVLHGKLLERAQARLASEAASRVVGSEAGCPAPDPGLTTMPARR